MADVIERKKLETLEININDQIYKLNGNNMLGVKKLVIEFFNGDWSLLVTKDEIYTSNDQN